MSFGTTLRTWREERGLSQLRLASSAEVSQRHISFLENGKAKPSREMVTHLGRVLRVPLKEQNHLLVAAGFSPEFSNNSVEDLAEVGEALQFMLKAHEPNMAIVVDRCWNIVFANTTALNFAAFLTPEPPLFNSKLNIMYGMFHPDGLGQFISNRAEVQPMLLWRLADDLDRNPNDPDLAQLYDEVRILSSFSPAELPAHQGIVGTVRFNLPAGEVSMFSCLASIESPADLTVSGLRIETFFPADAASADVWARLHW
jgi:transcriptional regulator with XRE-family HTH domain